jgi:hypothetical protein
VTAPGLSWPLRDVGPRLLDIREACRQAFPPPTPLPVRRVAGAGGSTTAAVTRSEGIVRGLDKSEFRARFGLGERQGKRDWLAVHCSRSRIRQQPHFFDTGNGAQNRAGVAAGRQKQLQPAPALRVVSAVVGASTAALSRCSPCPYTRRPAIKYCDCDCRVRLRPS